MFILNYICFLFSAIVVLFVCFDTLLLLLLLWMNLESLSSAFAFGK